MNTKLLNRLLAIRGFAISMVVGMLILATFPCAILAQDSASSVPVQSAPGQTGVTHFKSSFNHLTTGFPLTGTHLAVSCETCHVSGNFKGTPKDCAGCHTVGRLISATPKDPNHIQTTKACDTCHTNTASFQSVVMDHTNVTQPCSTCHNGSSNAIKSMPSNHPPVNTGDACDSCHKNTFSFVTTTYHTVDQQTSGCAACHDTGANFIATVTKSATRHIPTTAPCELCHTSTTTFLGAGFDHSTIGSAACASCHGGQYVGVMTKPATHITTAAACETCHTDTSTPGGFVNWTMSHNGITAGCASCHTGGTVGSKNTVVLGKPASHIATTAPCETCHSDTTTPGGFKNWTMSHAGITTGCASCHTGATVGTTVVLGKPTNHITTSASCETCHSITSTSTGGFAVPNPAMNHTGITTGCASCHTSGVNVGTTVTTIAMVKPANHIVTTAACESCHTSTTTPGGFATWTMNHTGITTGCASCHGIGSAFYNAPTLVTLSASNHVPVGSAACESCHSPSGTATGGFTTSALPFTTAGHALVSGTTCAICHDTGVAYTGVKTKSSSHIGYAAGTGCDSCHTSGNTSGFTTFLNATFNHSSIGAATCTSCHGGSIAGVLAKPASHILTTLDCNACHSDTTVPGGFKTWTMNHTGITTGCASCHTGTTAGTTVVLGKPANHVTTSATCETCHSITSTSTGGFAVPNPAMSHAGITTGCATCHTGANVGTTVTTIVVGKPSTHIATTVACENCHTSTTTPGGFATWTMNHTGITTGCASCHATASTFYNVGALVTLSPTIHVPVGSTPCESCHAPASTSVGGFVTSALPMGTNGHALVSGTSCATCHDTGAAYSGVMTKPSSHITYAAQDCGTACHTAANTSGYTTFLGASGAHTVAPATGTCYSCHGGGTPGGLGQGNPAGLNQGKAISVGHIPTGTTDCGSCHSYTSFTTWTNAQVHSTVSGTACATCHGSTKSYSGVVVESLSIHIPIGSTACESCHSPSITSTGGFATSALPMGTSGHALVSGTPCATCHTQGATTSPYTGVVAQNSLTTHLPTTAACDTCHTSSNTSGFTNFLGASGSHTSNPKPSLGATCSGCHGGGTPGGIVASSGAKAISVGHIPIPTGDDCDACHTYTTFTGWTMSHTGITSGCASCHAASYAGVVVKPTYHISTSLACEQCHSITSTSSGGFAAPNWTMNHSANGNTSGCSTCHTGATLGSTVVLGKPANHVTTSATCETCHSTTNTNTGGFANPNPAMSHAGITTGCAACHTGANVGTTVTTIVVGKPATHIVTTAACETCHTSTTTPGGFATWTMNHTGITTGCATCHATGITFYNAPTLVTLSPTLHVPVTGISCESCHSPTSTSTGGFATAWTMGSTGHALVSGTPCATCHNDGVGFTGVVTKNSIIAHIVTTASCDSCHTSTNTSGYTTFLGATGAHTTAPTGTCISCHGGGTPGTSGTGGGKNMIVNHIPIGSLDCSACHSYTSFTTWTAPAVHTAVTGTACSSCHAGSYVGVVVKPATHIPYTSGDCSTCHTGTTTFVNSWTNSTVHTAVAGTACATCHATGKTYQGATMVTLNPGIHIPVGSTACESCHVSSVVTTGGFATSALPFTANHSLVSGTTCATCHTANAASSPYTGVVGQNYSSTHISSAYYPAQDCGTNCHTASSTGNYSVGGFLLLNMTGLPAHTGITTGCSNCHNNVIAKGTASFPGHVVVTGDCVSCHTPSNTGNYTSFLGAAGGHTMTAAAAAGTCANAGCHANGGAGKMYTNPPHIPSGTTQCDQCHTASFSSLSFLTATMNHAVVTATACATCHGGSYTTQGTTGAQSTTFITNHIPTAIIGAAVATTSTCSTCHSGTSNWTTMTSSTALHNGAQGGGSPIYCVTCHLSAGAYLEPSGFQAKSHKGASTSKDCSSSGCHRPLGSQGSSYTNWGG